MSSCLKHAKFFCSLPLMTIMHHCNESILLSKPNHTMSLCISLLCTFSVCGIHMSQEGTSCTPIYQIFYMNYEFRTPTPCMPKKKRIRAYNTGKNKKRVFLKILAQGKFFLNCFQYKWNEPSSPNTRAKHFFRTIESVCVLARKNHVQKQTILLKHQGISLFFRGTTEGNCRPEHYTEIFHVQGI